MNQKVMGAFLLLSVFGAFPVWAGKLSLLRTEVQSKCPAVEVPNQELVPLVRQAFLACEPGTLIQVKTGCQIRCLKSNQGNVIGSDESTTSSNGGKLQ